MFAKRTVAAVAAVLATMTFALAQGSIPRMETSVTSGEKAAAVFFTEDSVGDVQLGTLGLEKSKNAGVRNLAKTMVRDHTATADAGMRLAKTIGADDVKWQSSDENQMTLTRLSAYSGARFDDEYVKALVQAHESDISTANDALEFSTTPAVRRYLQEALRVDRKHLQMAESLRK